MKTLFVKIALVPLIVFLVVAATVILWSLRKVVTVGCRITKCKNTEGADWINEIWGRWMFVWEQYRKAKA